MQRSTPDQKGKMFSEIIDYILDLALTFLEFANGKILTMVKVHRRY